MGRYIAAEAAKKDPDSQLLKRIDAANEKAKNGGYLTTDSLFLCALFKDGEDEYDGHGARRAKNPKVQRFHELVRSLTYYGTLYAGHTGSITVALDILKYVHLLCSTVDSHPVSSVLRFDSWNRRDAALNKRALCDYPAAKFGNMFTKASRTGSGTGSGSKSRSTRNGWKSSKICFAWERGTCTRGDQCG